MGLDERDERQELHERDPAEVGLRDAGRRAAARRDEGVEVEVHPGVLQPDPADRLRWIKPQKRLQI